MGNRDAATPAVVTRPRVSLAPLNLDNVNLNPRFLTVLYMPKTTSFEWGNLVDTNRVNQLFGGGVNHMLFARHS